jgi:WhiB family redox-sensing transcriptional regulator
LVGNLDWQEKAACVGTDPEMFFPHKNNLTYANKAITLCFTCEVRQECSDYKERTGTKYGIWGGTFSRRGE